MIKIAFVYFFTFIENIEELKILKCLVFLPKQPVSSHITWKSSVISFKFSMVYKEARWLVERYGNLKFEPYIIFKIENGFYWLVWFRCEYLRTQRFKNTFFDQNNSLSQHSFKKWLIFTVTSFGLFLQKCIVDTIENCFCWLVYFYCGYLRAKRFKNVVIWPK